MTKLALEASSLENPFNRSFGSNVMSMGTKRTDICIARHPQEHPAVFAARFSRCRPLLRFIACCVLNDTQRAEVAIESCWLTASRNPPRFEYEGAFRSWLLRVLIDEAFAILRKKSRQKAPSWDSTDSRLYKNAFNNCFRICCGARPKFLVPAWHWLVPHEFNRKC